MSSKYWIERVVTKPEAPKAPGGASRRERLAEALLAMRKKKG